VFALRTPQILGWPDDDLVWFAEDDYLYRPDALTHLVAAARDIPQADYFALYGFVHGRVPDEMVPEQPRDWLPTVAGEVDGVRWERILSTTSTFGGRVSAINADQGVFRFCMVPHKNMFRDHDTCVVLQGFEPHQYRTLARSLVTLQGRSPKEWVRDAGLLPFLVATNLRAHRRPPNRRLFVAAVPNLASHLEGDKLADGTDWAAVAADVERWAATALSSSPPDAAPDAAQGGRAQATVQVSLPDSKAVSSSSDAEPLAPSTADATWARTMSS
jgi:hypothetical protein